MKLLGLCCCLGFALGFPTAPFAAPKPDQQAGKGGNTSTPESWFLQTTLIVQDNLGLVKDDRSGVIGRLDGASDDRDQHDLPAFENINSSRGAIVLTHGEEWGDDAGQYVSDYRSLGSGRQVWTLAVSASRPEATVTLSWEGLQLISPKPEGGYNWSLDNTNKIIKTLFLVDLETGNVIPATGKRGVMNSYTFDMNGAGERLFRWVQGDVLPQDLAISSATSLRAFGPLEADSTRALGSPAGSTSADAVIGSPMPPALNDPLRPDNPVSSRPRLQEQ